MNRNPSPDTRWKHGVSGNPGGAPKGKRLSTTLQEILDEPMDAPDPKYMTKREALARSMINKALLKADTRAAEFIAERTEGRVPDKLMRDSGPRLAMTDAELAECLLNRGTQLGPVGPNT